MCVPRRPPALHAHPLLLRLPATDKRLRTRSREDGSASSGERLSRRHSGVVGESEPAEPLMLEPARRQRAGGDGPPPKCVRCGATETPEWRSSEMYDSGTPGVAILTRK